jgi:hypothetical protein
MSEADSWKTRTTGRGAPSGEVALSIRSVMTVAMWVRGRNSLVLG